MLAAPPERLGRTAPAGERAEQNRAADRWRGSSQDRGYDARWRRESQSHLAAHPLCEYCEHGVFGPVSVTPAELTDHLYPARDYPALFWVPANRASSCRHCHDVHKQAFERTATRADLDDLARRLGRQPLTA